MALIPTSGAAIFTSSRGGGGGSVTNVSAMSSFPGLSVAVTSPTTTPTINITATGGETANRILATPNGSSGPLSIRALVVADEVAAGSTGQVQFNGGTTFAADSNFVWDNANKRLGIGASVPNTELTITAASYSSSFTGKGNSQVAIGGGITNGQFAIISFGNNPGDFAGIGCEITSSGSYLYLGTSNNFTTGITNSAIVIDFNGNVGIGTTSPNRSLEVAGTIWSNVSGQGLLQLIPNNGQNFIQTSTFNGGASQDLAISGPATATFGNFIVQANNEKIVGSSGALYLLTGSPNAITSFNPAGSTLQGLQITASVTDIIHDTAGPQLRIVGSAVGGNDSSMDFQAINLSAVTYLRLGLNATSGGVGSEAGGFFFSTIIGGTLTQKMQIMADGGIQLGAGGLATGGSQGVGTINVTGGYYVNGVLGSGAFSDKRLKTNVTPLKDGLAIIAKLNPVKYDWNEDGRKLQGSAYKTQTHVGFIADDVHRHLPESKRNTGQDWKDYDDRAVIAALVSAVKELKAQNEDLRADIRVLKAESVLAGITEKIKSFFRFGKK